MPLTAPPATPRPWLADPSPLVRGYRRTVPLPLRRAVVAVTGPGLRRAAMRGLGGLSAASGVLRMRRARRRLRRAGLLAGATGW
ncbi:hypothetical protein SSPO_060350 [Streptomyces antimycoticus]|uniref:Uncharacterized protein n=1 Tax=Streptomyces antimycoticus TaxID=68175 RepID=A0A499VB08_9ACTN|nr:hypothetical protein [Streptomyces antimycoticus]BBJ43317.1 hypothetical protein SSPO_060350 [Streptomyces antimycoticus]